MDMWTDDQMRSIHKMLNPRSIAVVGASPKGGYGGRLLNAVLKAKDALPVLIKLYVDAANISGTPFATTTTNLDGQWSLPNLALSEASHTLKVTAFDTLSHEVPAGIEVVLDAGAGVSLSR